MQIRDWLIRRAEEEFLVFDSSDFAHDCNEILKEFDSDLHQGKEEEIRDEIWSLLSVWQQDKEYISSLNLHRIIAKKIRTSCRKAKCEDTLGSWVKNSVRLHGLAGEVANAIRDAWKVRNPSRTDAAQKFSNELVFDSIDMFHLGLENLIGYPTTNTEFLHSMKQEHARGDIFVDQKGRKVDPKVEWNIVMRSDAWNIEGAGCNPIAKSKKRVCDQPLDFYVQRSKEIFEKACAAGMNSKGLNDAEVAGLRLWTGPMYKKYAELLRNPQNPTPYVTTLHAINSGITKLARIWRLPYSRKVYRGYTKMKMKNLKKDVIGCTGGVEKCVLATSEDFDIAVNYSEDGAFILEFEVGQVNRGADVSWLSQFPHEREVLFNAMSNVEFVCSTQQRFVEGRGAILVFQACLSANVKSKTLDEFFRLRKDLHLNLVDMLTQEAQRVISERENCGIALIKNLGAECRKVSEGIRKEAEEAELYIFNEGTPAHVNFVEVALMFQSRALEIIDMACRWFDAQTAVPAETLRLLDWQVQALKTVFKFSDRPTVTSIVLEPNRTIPNLFGANSVSVGDVHNLETACGLATLLSLNPELDALDMEVPSASAELWEKVFRELCPGRPTLCINGLQLADYAVSTLQRLELRDSSAQMATIIAAAMQFNVPSALTSLSLFGSPIGCAGAESLSHAFSSLKNLRYVNLRSCQIADRGCTGIAKKISTLTGLQNLNLANNLVKDDGFNVLASEISRLPRMKSVDMRFNQTQLPSVHFGPQFIMKNHLVSKLSHRTAVHSVSWSPGGDQIASGYCDNTIIIWDAKTGTQVSKLKGHSDWVVGVAWSPNGDQFASGSWDNSIIIWDAKKWKQVLKLKGRSHSIHCVGWSPDGDQIASGSSDGIIVWDARAGKQVSTLAGHAETVKSVAWSPMGDRLASGSCDKTIIIWNWKTGQQVSTLIGHSETVQSVAWSPKGDEIVSGCGHELQGQYKDDVIIWEVMTGGKISKLKGHSSTVMSVGWSPDGNHIASGSYDRDIIIWDAKSHAKVMELKGHSGFVFSVAWNPHSNQIVSGSLDTNVIIWDTKVSEQVTTLSGHPSPVLCLEWSPKGDKVVCGLSDNSVIIWNVKTGEQVSKFRAHSLQVTSIAEQKPEEIDKCITSIADDENEEFDDFMTSIAKHQSKSIVNSVPSISDYESEAFDNFTTPPKCVSWSPDGDQIAGSSYTAIVIWDAMTGDQLSTLTGHSSQVLSVAWSPTGAQIASGSDDKTIVIWDTRTMKQVWRLKGHISHVICVAWSPNGDHIVSGCDIPVFFVGLSKLFIWNTKTGKHVSTLIGHRAKLMCLSWSPTGNEIASGYSDSDGTIIIWDVTTSTRISTLKGFSNKVTSVAWSPAGDQLASGSIDSSIIIWDVKAGKPNSKLKGHTGTVRCVAWSTVCNRIASASNTTIMFWDIDTTDNLVKHDDSPESPDPIIPIPVSTRRRRGDKRART